MLPGMHDIILTGASRGIGRALALELGRRDDTRLWLCARSADALRSVAERCRHAEALPIDLSSVAEAGQLGRTLCERMSGRALLIHNAGVWPGRRELTAEGYERAYAINHAAPLALQAPLLEAHKLARVLVISAGLIGIGKVDPSRTPSGRDFSALRTYANTKRAFAEAVRELAPRHPEVDFVVVHPGVVRTELGARPGIMGRLLDLAKRRWEAPEICAVRLTHLIDRPQVAQPGQAAWYFETEPKAWPI